ncbi:hypothetical protein K505DRAFT_44601 [Melanomma pulvis-pyrius CBS 109.77]|uniref:Uncharacterized protein n=1 Tax=Melanomma pulvis-pyrius CBS 109.77 TaxID=1314802 RepID=A0A6A6XAP7_9PLEO|nr:hypothetical protein K505DRAFT_44601 [Melanomma pulvis-pyrius CBS 109.77]
MSIGRWDEVLLRGSKFLRPSRHVLHIHERDVGITISLCIIFVVSYFISIFSPTNPQARSEPAYAMYMHMYRVPNCMSMSAHSQTYKILHLPSIRLAAQRLKKDTHISTTRMILLTQTILHRNP